MKIKKILTCILAFALSITCFAGCGSSQGLDTNKSTLYVGIFKAGLGTTWLDNSIKDFEEYYKNTSFEDGKMGVQVVMDARTEEFKTASLSTTMQYNKNGIYFLDQSDYEVFLSKGVLADITDTIKENVYDDDGNLLPESEKDGATKSILDTMSDEWVGYHERDGKYYAIPYRVGVSGIIYDADLFNKNKYYFDKNGDMGLTQADIDLGVNGEIGPGPDGVVGTADDGMPETYNDFIKLMKQMSQEDDVIPFTWSGATPYQRVYAYESVWANYQGYNDYALNYSFNGTTTNGDVVTESNFKDYLVDQEGRKAGIKFFHDIMRSPNGSYYSSTAMTQAHSAAQLDFIGSVNRTKRIAMFMDGGYWENEAREDFNTMAQIDSNYGYGKRDFRILPIPNFVGTEGIANQTNTSEKEVLLGRGANSIVCLAKTSKNDNPELQLQLAKLFLQFVQSRKQMSNFVRDTGACFRTYDFSATPDELINYTKFGQSIYRYIEEGSKILADVRLSDKRKSVGGSTEFFWSYSVKFDVEISDPATTFNKYKTLSVEECYTEVKERLMTA